MKTKSAGTTLGWAFPNTGASTLQAETFTVVPLAGDRLVGGEYQPIAIPPR